MWVISMPVYPSTVSDRTEPIEYEVTPVEWFDQCVHCSACSRAHAIPSDVGESENSEELARELNCSDCEYYDDGVLYQRDGNIGVKYAIPVHDASICVGIDVPKSVTFEFIRALRAWTDDWIVDHGYEV